MRFVSSPSAEPPPVDRDALVACLADFPVALAVLFGSVGTDEDTRLSDLDIAVQLADDVGERREVLDDIRAALLETSGRDAVDLVDLETAPPALGYEALSTGELLLGDEDEATALEARFLVRTLDFRPIRDRWQRALDRRIEEGEYGRP